MTNHPSSAESLRYPETRKVDQTDVYHGVTVSDPYRWLEDDVRTSEDVHDWVEAQNKVSFGYLKAIPQRDAIESRLTKLWNYEKYSAPFKRGGRYYYFKNNGLQNQDVLFMQDRLDAEATVLIDPNEWSEDGTVALAGLAFSDDGRYLAYGIQEAGSDWRTWRVMEIATRKVLEEGIQWVKFSSATWTRDSKGFFYGRFDAPEEGEAFQSLNLNQKIYYHRIGTSQDQDVLVYHRPDEPTWGFGTSVTQDGQFLVLTVWKGTDDRYRILYRDLTEPYAAPVDLIDNFEQEFSFVGNDGHVFYFVTDWEAPRKRLIAIDIRKPARENWQVIIPESDNALNDVNLVGNLFVASYLQDAKTAVKIYDMQGEHVRDVEFPGIGTARGFSGRRGDTETFYSFSSFATPPSTYRYDLITGKSTKLRQAEVDFDPELYEVKQVFYKSKDGTKVPMFIAHKKGLELDDNNPTLLYGYGGFSIPLTPSFSISRLAWMEMGGVFAMANLRGGGEYGEEWHKAGTKLTKQNVFDDFIAAAEWLIDNDYTKSSKLAIQGGSNGGLLVGAAITQRPDLFGAALPAVGVMDMLRFHKFTAGRFWVDDYGSADNPEEFQALYKYSPYHNLKAGIEYPPTLVTTADTDDRVVPGHSFKFAARLQEYHEGDAPVLIRIETKAGHGSGKPTSKIIEEIADQWAFLVKNLGMEIESK
ncbi:prolyl oligopeptidase family serine peptidase [Thalassoroseus pseudoceratinae]|uniref:prolyl oligopeptidase family serine peptidase n=1 Tax=Thalassoroseus pseudoceratinae TaxID=2713176 RepID=UPI00141E3714|nr:prolyl oligopeptidase family serine peptidase [Thalassoroseus pseudoceratinae]